MQTGMTPYFGQLAISSGALDADNPPLTLRLISAHPKDAEAGKARVDEVVLQDSPAIAELTQKTGRMRKKNPLEPRHWTERILPALREIFGQGGELSPEKLPTGGLARKFMMGLNRGKTPQEVFRELHPAIEQGLRDGTVQVTPDGDDLLIRFNA